MQKLDLKHYELENGNVQKYTFPGGYPIFFLAADGGVICPDCVNKERKIIDEAGETDRQWFIVSVDVKQEGNSVYCEHCNQRIPRKKSTTSKRKG